MLAALASAAMPSIVMAGVRDSERANDTDDAAGIDQAVMQDAAGRMYDIYACDTEDGRKRLTGRVQAARTLERAKDPGGLGFALDTVLAFVDGREKSTLTGGATVMVAAHNDGVARPLDLLTLDDCAAMGTAIGAIHRLRPNFLQAESYPVFSTGQIRAQLTAWIKRLRQAGHVPPEITSSWGRIIETEGLWSFVTCPVHGGFSDGDVLFSGATVTAVTNWQNMQVNDPARDLAWIFGKIDEDHRNAVLAAYGRMMGSRLDDLIMLRANLWLQMEQVGEFIDALNRADSQKIIQFKAQVERLAHQLGAFTRKTAPATTSGAQSSKPPSTITVGTLLNDDDRRSEIFTDEQVTLILSQKNTPTGQMVIALLACGVRIYELLHFKHEDFHRTESGAYLIGGCKTEAGRNRIIPILDFGIPVFEHAYATSVENGPLFPNGKGGFWNEKNWRNRKFYPFLEEIGIQPNPYDENGKRKPEFAGKLATYTPYTTRHTYASLCDRAGVNKDILKRAVGHTPKSKTLDEVYLHPKATQMIEAFDKANQLVNDEVLTTTKA